MTLQPEPLGVVTQGKLVLRKRTSEQPQAGQQNVENPETTAGAVGGVTLLNIPPCSMAEGSGEQSQSLFRPPMSDPEVDLEHQRGARPKVTGPQTAHTKKEEAKATSTEQHVLLESSCCDETREPWNLCTDRRVVALIQRKYM